LIYVDEIVSRHQQALSSSGGKMKALSLFDVNTMVEMQDMELPASRE
jgi:hypothetical protein